MNNQDSLRAGWVAQTEFWNMVFPRASPIFFTNSYAHTKFIIIPSKWLQCTKFWDCLVKSLVIFSFLPQNYINININLFVNVNVVAIYCSLYITAMIIILYAHFRWIFCKLSTKLSLILEHWLLNYQSWERPTSEIYRLIHKSLTLPPKGNAAQPLETMEKRPSWLTNVLLLTTDVVAMQFNRKNLRFGF